MGQEYLPGRLGVSAGVTIGLSIGLGGVGAPLLGLLADAHGLRAVFEAMAALPVLALVLTAVLPARAPAARSGAREGEPLGAAGATEPPVGAARTPEAA
jgi:FSR family fosmidomycin resistance protein-like MFS transporter